jgi:hypothetical protein
MNLCGFEMYDYRIKAHSTRYSFISYVTCFKGKYKFMYQVNPVYLKHRDRKQFFSNSPVKIENPERFLGYKRYTNKIMAKPFYVKFSRR